MSPVIEKTNNLIERLLTSQILVGLDIGYKTIGIAVSDRSFTIATPLNTHMSFQCLTKKKGNETSASATT